MDGVRFGCMETNRRLNESEWEPILIEQASSGLSVEKFCQARGFKRTSFYAARKRRIALLSTGNKSTDTPLPEKPKKRAQAHQVATSSVDQAFVAVHVAAATSVSTDISAEAHHNSSRIRVALRSGHQLWVELGFSSEHLRQLVTVLESLT